jgi:hypothetical protein
MSFLSMNVKQLDEITWMKFRSDGWMWSIRWNLSPWVDRDDFFKTELTQDYKMNFEP